MADAGDKTEQATGRRLQKAADEGQFAYSSELTSALTLAACTAMLFYSIGSPAAFRTFFASILGDVIKADNPEIMVSIIRQTGIYFLVTAGPIFATAIFASLVGNAVQGLPRFAKEALKLKFEKLNPIQGLSRLKTKVSPLEWLKLFFLMGVIAWIVYTTFTASWEQLVTLSARSIESSNLIVLSVMRRIVTYIVVAVCILAGADFIIQRKRFKKSVMQTKAEVKEDMKALEGNPAVKGKIKQIQREAGRRRMMSRVVDADVIVTNPTHYAVALEYKPDQMGAPRVVAKGQNFLAERIKELGREHDIPTVENVPLARALYRSVEIEQEIPLELYKAVAEVLAYVYKVRKLS